MRCSSRTIQVIKFRKEEQRLLQEKRRERGKHKDNGDDRRTVQQRPDTWIQENDSGIEEKDRQADKQEASEETDKAA